jgi:hypothetical protein
MVQHHEDEVFGYGVYHNQAVYRCRRGCCLWLVAPDGTFTPLHAARRYEVHRFPPLGADLHTHLLGTGDGAWWLGALERAAAEDGSLCFTDEDLLKSLLPPVAMFRVSRGSGGYLARDLLAMDDQDMLRQAFELRGPVPGEFTPTFSPGSFILKGPIIKARPETIAELIMWNTRRYALEGGQIRGV